MSDLVDCDDCGSPCHDFRRRDGWRTCVLCLSSEVDSLTRRLALLEQADTLPGTPETRTYYRARPDQVADLEAQGYRVVGGHVYAVDDVSLLAVRQCWCVAGACVCGGEPRGD